MPDFDQHLDRLVLAMEQSGEIEILPDGTRRLVRRRDRRPPLKTPRPCAYETQTTNSQTGENHD